MSNPIARRALASTATVLVMAACSEVSPAAPSLDPAADVVAAKALLDLSFDAIQSRCDPPFWQFFLTHAAFTKGDLKGADPTFVYTEIDISGDGGPPQTSSSLLDLSTSRTRQVGAANSSARIWEIVEIRFYKDQRSGERRVVRTIDGTGSWSC